MQPRNHLLETYRDLTARGRKSVVGRLEKGQSFLVGQERRPQVIGTAARAWRPADVALNRIDQAIVAMGEAVFDVWSNAELTVEAKRARAQVAYAEAKATTDSDVEIVRSAADSVTETLRTAAYPSRPEPRDAAQEAAIAGIKSDLMLVLGNVEADVTLIRTMTSQLSRALGDGEELATWLLASSRWPEDYLTSRGMGQHVEGWHAEVASALDVAAPSDLAAVRQAYNAVAGPSGGLSDILVPIASLLPQILAEQAEFSTNRTQAAGW